VTFFARAQNVHKARVNNEGLGLVGRDSVEPGSLVLVGRDFVEPGSRQSVLARQSLALPKPKIRDFADLIDPSLEA
jgi:hypothetical protein